MANDVVWVPVLPTFKNFQRELDAGVDGAGKSAGQKLGSSLGGALKTSVKATGVAAGALLATSLTLGFQRLTAIEDAQAKLKGLGNSAADVDVIMKNALSSVKGTAFGLDAAATTAAGAIAAGIKPGQELEGVLKSVANSAAAAGMDMDEMGGIYNKVASVGKAQNDVLRQVADRGIPIYEALSTQLGVTSDEVFKMASAGKIGFAEFEQAMTTAGGTVADELGKTTTGAISNLRAALGRLGASLLESSMPHFTSGIQMATGWVDTLTEKLGPVADVIGQRLGSALSAVVGWLSRLDFSSWTEFTNSFGGAGIFDSIKSSVIELQPAFVAFRDALPAIGSAAVQLGSGALQILARVLKFLADNVDTIVRFMPALLAGYAAWRVSSAALAASQMRLQLAQTMMAPVFLASNLLRWQAVRGEAALAAAQSTTAATTATNTAATTTNTAAQNMGILARGRAVVGMVAHRVAMIAGTVATWASTAATAAFGVALAVATSPITLIVVGIAALVAGLVLFFTKTETGRAIWQSFTGALLSGWEWVKSAFASAWAVISPIFTGIMNAAKTVAGVVVTGFLLYIRAYWFLVSNALSLAWNTIIKPIFSAFAAVATWLWTSVLMPVFNFIKAGFQLVAAAFSFYWNNVIKPTWNALGAGIKWVWETVIRPAWDALKIALGAVGDFFTWVWNSVIKPAWDALGAGIRWVWDNVVSPVFEGIKTGLDLVKSAFRTAVDIIGSVWNEMREKTAAPIRFVIDTVYNKGIVGVWNKVAGWLGMDDKKLDEMKLSFASGGVMPGYTPGRDVHKFINPNTGQGLELSGGEAIMRPEWTRAVGGAAAVDRMNRDARYGRVRKHGRESAAFANGGVLSFAAGGIVEAMTRIVQAKYPMIQMTSGLRASNDLHGQGMAGDFSNGSGNTPAQLALANDIADTYPGSMELIYDSPGFDRTIKNGAFVGPFGQFYTWGQAGNHQHHVHWAMNTPPTMPFGGGVFEGGSDGSGGGGGSVIGSLVRSAMDKIMDPIMSAIPEGPGLIGGLGKGFGTKVWDEFKGWILSKVPSAGGSGAYGDWVGTPGVEQFRGLVEKLLKEKGQPLSLVGSVLRRMNQESGGDPNIVNNWDSNAAAGHPSKGLMQTIDPTFQAYKDPGYDNIWDPESNIRASMNYALATYGSLSAAYDRAGGYDNGGYLMPGTTLSINETDKPEPVFTNPQWTLIKSLVISTAELLDPIRVMAMHGRDAARHIADIADSTRRQLDHQIDMAGAAVWAALPGEVKDAVTIAGAVGAQWEKVSGYLNEKAIAWSKGEWPIGSARTPTVEPGPGWRPFLLDDSLGDVARANVDLAEQVIAGKVSAGNDPVANALFDIFGRDPILPDLARIASMGPNAIEAATDAALHAFETGETARMEEWTASNSQLTEAVLRARDAAIVTGQMVQGAVNGYLNWAMASDSQGRMGSWQEYFQHYGGEYGTAQGDWLLSQVGLGGIIGGKFKDSFANLLIATAESPLLSAPPILDDEGRVIGTQLQSTPEVAATPQATVLAEPPTVDLPDDTIDLDTAPVDAGTKVSIEIPDGKTALSIDEFKEILVRIDERLDNVEIAIDGEADPAPLGLGVGGIA